jgi:uncharacterized protein YfaS (alpha-2-macroglobulin family)
MLARLFALAIMPPLAVMLPLCAGLARAEVAGPRIETVTAEPAGDTARGCLAFSKPVEAEGDAQPGDFLSFEPQARPAVQVNGNRLCLEGLAYGTRYAVTVQPGLVFTDGSRTETRTTATVLTPDRDPMVAVGGRGWLLPRQTATGLTIQTVNVPLVRVRVLRVSERQLAAGTRPDPSKQFFTLDELWDLTRQTATEVWSGTMRTGPARNRTVETAFPLTGLIDPARPGAFIVLAEDASRPPAKLLRDLGADYDWRAAQAKLAGHWVLSTDLGLTSLQGLDGLHVTVRSFASAAPVAGVRVQLISRGQDVLGDVTTSSQGEAVFAAGLIRGKHAAAPASLVARSENGDMAVQDLTSPAFDLSDRGADGRVIPGPTEAYVYTDRGIYRPGETIHAMALLRTHGLSAVDGTGLTLLLRRPDGVEAGRVTLPPQPAAGFGHSIRLSPTAPQGDWTIEARVDPTLPPVGRALVSVRDFVPQQLKVTLTGPNAAIVAGQNIEATIEGRFLYGAPAAGLHAEGEVRLVRDEHPIADAREYSFGLVDETIADPVTALDLEDADDSGRVAIDAPLKIPPGLTVPLQAVIDAGLMEPGGRAVRETLAIPLRSPRPLIGIRKLFGDRVQEGSAATFAVTTFSGDGTPIALRGLSWQLVREDQRWDWWRPDNGSWSFHYHTVDVPVADGRLDVVADHPVELSRTLEWGTYRLVVTDPANGAATSVRFSVGWGGEDQAADIPDRLEVRTDRPVLDLGQSALVHLRGPFAGTAEVSVEAAGKILQTRRLDLPANGATFELSASQDWGPGVHVLATAYRPLSAPAGPHDPIRAVGLSWIGMDPAPHTLGVTLGAPARVTPRQALRVPLHVTGAHGPAFVTLAAVDEGILQLTHFASPDPVAALLSRTRLGLDMRDDYGRLLEGKAETGVVHEGGDSESLGGAGLPVTTRKTVALFEGPVALDERGDATITLDIPDFAGELRLMAVAYDSQAAGHAEAPLTVRDPVVADLSLPRFLAPGDLAEMSISLNDTDGPAGDYHLVLTSTGAVALQGAARLDAHLLPGQRAQAHLQVGASELGIGHLEAVLTGPGNLRIEHGWDIAVRSPHPDLVVSKSDSQAPGETYTPDAALLKPFIPGSVQVTIGYSSLGGIDIPGLLQSLYTYPFGCTEQLSASAFPLLYFDDARLIGRTLGDPAIRERVQGAIDAILDRQGVEGQFGLWRLGDDAASVWLNVYALDFLLHAREAGFTVPERATAASAAWIDQHLASEQDVSEGAYAAPAQPTRAYAAYVLARTNRVDPYRLRALRADLEWGAAGGSIIPGTVGWRNKVGLAFPLSLAQLAGAQSLMGDPSGSAATFRLALANLDAAKAPGWWYGAFYYSPFRDLAGVLAVAAETNHPEVSAPLLERITSLHPDPEHLNTQEKAWLLMAGHALLKQGTKRTLSINGQSPTSVSLPFAVSPSSEEIARGTSIRNADSAPVFRTLTIRGAPAVAPPAVSQGFKLARETFTLEGERLNDARLRQTDRFVVVLSGSVDQGAFRRVVIVDPLPAGLEIEAPILRENLFPFLGQLSQLRAHEERDDRFMAAFDIGSDSRFRDVDDDVKKPLADDEFRIAYLVRAVTPGRFVRPETLVQDMYQPQVMARTAAGSIEVSPR